jgi:hypothetical protein
MIDGSMKVNLSEKKPISKQVLLNELKYYGASLGNMCDSMLITELMDKFKDDPAFKAEVQEEIIRIFSMKLKEFDTLVVTTAIKNMERSIAGDDRANPQMVTIGRKMLEDQMREAKRIVDKRTNRSPNDLKAIGQTASSTSVALSRNEETHKEHRQCLLLDT